MANPLSALIGALDRLGIVSLDLPYLEQWAASLDVTRLLARALKEYSQ
jgi:hypothetical protein